MNHRVRARRRWRHSREPVLCRPVCVCQARKVGDPAQGGVARAPARQIVHRPARVQALLPRFHTRCVLCPQLAAAAAECGVKCGAPASRAGFRGRIVLHLRCTRSGGVRTGAHTAATAHRLPPLFACGHTHRAVFAPTLGVPRARAGQVLVRPATAPGRATPQRLGAHTAAGGREGVCACVACQCPCCHQKTAPTHRRTHRALELLAWGLGRRCCVVGVLTIPVPALAQGDGPHRFAVQPLAVAPGHVQPPLRPLRQLQPLELLVLLLCAIQPHGCQSGSQRR